MATRQWNGSNADFGIAADWNPAGVPGSGDLAVINAGTVTVSSNLPGGLTIDMFPVNFSHPVLILNNAGLTPNVSLFADNQLTTNIVQTFGATFNSGSMNFSNGGSGRIEIYDGANGAAGFLTNAGQLNYYGVAAGEVISKGANPTTGLINNGVITLQNTSDFTTFVVFNAPIYGTGQIQVAAGATVRLAGAVESGQTITFGPGLSGSTLALSNAATYHGLVSGFGPNDEILFTGTPWDSENITDNGSTSTLTFSSGGTAVATIVLQGTGYNTSDVYASQGAASNGKTTTSLTTSLGDATVRVNYTDAVTQTSGTSPGFVYKGPVAGLQYQYIWNSTDSAALTAVAPNMFIKGNVSDDALSVTGGNNVLDGSTGSNFLVGGTNPGNTDTFFVDGRGGGVTWSTIVNFHQGDQATIFGFKAGQSTLPFTASDGVDGYKGATIHSELGGAGTGINASMTFANVSLETAQHFAITTGTVGGTDYLLIQYV